MQYDPSGYLFDRTTNLYFDQSSNYFYNSETGQYLYWDAKLSTYVLASNDTTSAATSSNSQTPAMPVNKNFLFLKKTLLINNFQ